MQRLTDGGRRFIDHVSKGIGYALENGKKMFKATEKEWGIGMNLSESWHRNTP